MSMPKDYIESIDLTKEQVLAAMTACGLPENIRGEKLTLQNFADLSRALKQV